MKYKGTLNLSFTVEAENEEEAIRKVDWLINESSDAGYLDKIKIRKIS